MHFTPWTFRYMTRVHLSSQIGYGYQAERRHSVKVIPTQTGRAVYAQTRTVRYIARNCPYLEVMVLEPNTSLGFLNADPRLPGAYKKVRKTKAKHDQSLIDACKELARSSPALSTMVFRFCQCKLWLDPGGNVNRRERGGRLHLRNFKAWDTYDSEVLCLEETGVVHARGCSRNMGPEVFGRQEVRGCALVLPPGTDDIGGYYCWGRGLEKDIVGIRARISPPIINSMVCGRDIL